MSPRASSAAPLDEPSPPVSASLGTYYELALAHLEPSKLNPRRRMTGIEELTDSVRQVGIIEPLLVRPIDGTRHEVVAGGRRLEAAKRAGLAVVPCIVRVLTDAQALDLAIVENDQRSDIHPVDEAEAFAKRMTLERNHTPEKIAATIGRPARYVKERLRLLELIGDAKKAFLDDQLTLGHALILSRMTPELQGRALKTACFDTAFDFETGKGEQILGPASVRRLQEFFDNQVRLDVTTPEAQEEFPELASDVATARAAGAQVLMLSDVWGPASKPGAPLNKDEFTEAKKTTKGAVLGVFVQGRRRGKTTWVTVTPKSKPSAAPKPTTGTAGRAAKTSPQQLAADKRAKTAEAQRVQDAKAKREREQVVMVRALTQLAKSTTPATLTTPTALREVCEALSGADSFDQEVVDQVARAIGVPVTAFEYHGRARAKLAAPALAKVVAVLTVGARSFGGESGDAAAAFKAFGVDVKAIDKAVAKEQAVAAAAKLVAPKGPVAVDQVDLDQWGELVSAGSLGEKTPRIKGTFTHDDREYAATASMSQGGHDQEVEAYLVVPRAAWKQPVFKTSAAAGLGYKGLVVTYKQRELVLSAKVRFVPATARKAGKKR